MKKLIIGVAVVMLMLAAATSSRAQTAPIAMQSSTALEASHIFTGGNTLASITVTWHAGSAAARWLMIFDALAVPGNGTVAPIYCVALGNSATLTDGTQAILFNTAPILVRTGITAVVSTSTSGCASLTVDGSDDYFSAQVR
ncbi:MAG: hypothetical protein WBQ34_10140 [Candidatus Acidiferrales bacterium]